MINLFSFAAGFFVAVIIAVTVIAIVLELHKKRAMAFSKRFSVISEALSSLKALSFRLAAHLKKISAHIGEGKVSPKDLPRIKEYLDGVAYVLDNISTGMMPPTEEIAMEALKGKKSPSEKRAYEDSLRFRDDVRKMRQFLEKEGLDGLGRNAKQRKVFPRSIEIIEADNTRTPEIKVSEDHSAREND